MLSLIDANGNLTSDGKNTYVWDAENRLIEVNNSAGKSKFAYDPLGRRVSISETPTGRATTTTNYLWCGAKPCQAINPLNGARNEFYAQGEMQNGKKYYYATDHLGSVTDLLDINGTNVASIDYSPYGRKLKQTGTVQPTFGYAGMMEHQSSGLNLTWYRGYDAKSGRWLSEDPIGFNGGVNLYGYVGGNVVNQIDPTGEFGIVGGVIGIGVELGVQAVGNYINGCDIFNKDNYDWYDVAISGVFGAVAPGVFTTLKGVNHSFKAINNLTKQLDKANTLNRQSKLSRKIQEHKSTIKDHLVEQGVYQSVSKTSKQINGGDKKSCECQK